MYDSNHQHNRSPNLIARNNNGISSPTLQIQGRRLITSNQIQLMDATNRREPMRPTQLKEDKLWSPLQIIYNQQSWRTNNLSPTINIPYTNSDSQSSLSQIGTISTRVKPPEWSLENNTSTKHHLSKPSETHGYSNCLNLEFKPPLRV